MRSGSPLTVPLQGGLGNQLFELAAGLTLTARTGRPIVFNDHWLTHPVATDTPRSFALAGLLREDELTHTPLRRKVSMIDTRTGRRVQERTADDDTLARVTRRTRLVAGYFQRIDYVDAAWAEIARRLGSSGEPHHSRLVQGDVSSPYGAVHYRLGDYATNPHAYAFHGVTPPSYFAELIAQHCADQRITEWRIVSDEPRRALELIRQEEGLPTEVRLIVDSSDEWGDLAALSGAAVLGISNSSFSWWAGYIATRVRSAHVVAPRPWFADAATREPPLFPEAWQRLSRRL